MEGTVETARQLMLGLLEQMGVKTEVEGFIEDEVLYLEVKGDQEGILIGKHGRTLDALQVLINRMVNKQLRNPVRVALDVDAYRRRRGEALTNMAIRLGEKAKRMGQPQTIGPFTARERRVIHMALKEDPLLTTESIGEGRIKRIAIIPRKRDREKVDPLV